MKLVINYDYGGYSVPKAYCVERNIDPYKTPVERNDPDYVAWVEAHADEEGHYDEGWANLTVVEIPDDATDYEVLEYDGAETVIYVQNGKIIYAD